MRISDWSSDVCSSDLSAIKKTACSTVSIPANLGGGRGMSDDPNPQQPRTRCVLDAVHGQSAVQARAAPARERERRSEEHTSELQSLMRISYAVFCLKKKKKTKQTIIIRQKEENATMT